MNLSFNTHFLFYIFALLYGLATGSLLNVVIYRLPRMLKSEWLAQCAEYLAQDVPEKNTINLFFPRSFCPACNTTIKAHHNIPVLSWLWLKGQCKTCKHAISWRYPFIELLTALLFVINTWHFGLSWPLAFALIFISIIVALIFIDLDHQILPDSLTYSLLWTGLIANTQSIFAPLPDAVLGAAAGWFGLWIFIKGYALITGKIGMGNGDFKLFAALGAWFGWMCLPFILLFSCVVGSIVGLACLKWQHKSTSTPIPFGPFLCMAGLVVLWWKDDLLAWLFWNMSG